MARHHQRYMRHTAVTWQMRRNYAEQAASIPRKCDQRNRRLWIDAENIFVRMLLTYAGTIPGWHGPGA
eukprot:1172477-Prorocentrum_minimum.AAC.3